MPTFLERSDIPGPLYRALTDNSYQQGLSAYRNSLSPQDQKIYDTDNLSVTSLPQSPRQRWLAIRHARSIIIDPISRFFALYGTMMHATLEKYAKPGDLVEMRLGINVNGVWVHGQADLYEPDTFTLSDYKVTSTESAMYSDHYEHVCQLNVLKYIFELHGYTVNRLRNIYLYRNWTRRDIGRDKYPEEQIQDLEVPIWTREEVVAYLNGRVWTHMSAKSMPDDDLPYCSPKERWERPAVWKVFKVDPKTGRPQTRAKHRCDTKEQADGYIGLATVEELQSLHEKNNAKVRAKKTDEELLASVSSYVKLELPGRPVKCSFCDSSQFCSQRLSELENYEEEEDE